MDASRNPLIRCRCSTKAIFPAILCEMKKQYGYFSLFTVF
ncbi:Hypothetical protein, conserved [Brucella abortus str. 2308 A]|uniref:Uncharacterized protein n=1 Tax=Brucella suis (strain ATCC 23445 / NCTC 10510) TaxID=470137 RepID=B0CLN3_BRUSI|nr:Hypothetical protein BSUIS_A0948 [Brucella suis ATCC 23445]EEP64387.1 Hypothetical protein, conserved [Brucella abortus str. 2308 A]EFM57601.1 Hypothetical protein BIBO1_0468 [Brucella inopinata BO1]